MIYQGLFNILSLYLEDIDLFYNAVDSYFHKLINNSCSPIIEDKEELNEDVIKLSKLIESEFLNLGFEPDYIETFFSKSFLEISITEEDYSIIHTPYDLYRTKFGPLIYELFMEKMVNYIIDPEVTDLILNWKSKNLLPIELIVELTNLKNLFNANPDKEENLRRYLLIREKFIEKLSLNKGRIEGFENLKDPKVKLQLIYLIYRIISFFNITKNFDFSPIKDYITKNIDEWLLTIPLVTLKNPDLYFCGLYLAKELKIGIDREKVKTFLLELYEEGIDEFEAPLMEATDGIYYFLKATQFMDLWLSDFKIKRLFDADPKYFESNYLKTLETSQLVVILKLYNLMRFSKVEQNIKVIKEEITTRITPEGIKQNRDGLISSEATYYVLFCNYMRNNLGKLKEFDLLNNVISRVYRNLEILDFTEYMNYDLISELFYSLEIFKLYNCIETKEMIFSLAIYLFPSKVVEKISKSGDLVQKNARYRHLKVDRITGETVYS